MNACPPERYRASRNKIILKPTAPPSSRGGTFVHGLVITNLIVALAQALRSCRVLPSEVRLRVNPVGLYTYPDVMVVCDEPRFADDRKDTLLNPIVIFEVLSKSTEAHDRGLKFAQYRKIESLQEYALVSQSEPRIERFLRQPGGEWLLTESVGLDTECRFESLGCSIPLSGVYDNVTLGLDEA